MKKYIIILLLFLGLNTNAQTGLYSYYNSTYSGENISFGVSKSLSERATLGLGIRYNINRDTTIIDANIIYKRLYATKFVNYLGIESFFEYKLLNKKSIIKPTVFYDIQATYAATHNNFGYITLSFGPFLWLEQNIGLGLNTNIYKSLDLVTKAGFGSCFVLGKDDTLASKFDNHLDASLSYILQIGLNYSIR